MAGVSGIKGQEARLQFIAGYLSLRKSVVNKLRIEVQHKFCNATIMAIKLAQLRKLKGMTQAELASKMGITPPRVSQLEKSQTIRIDTLRHYVETLGFEFAIRAKDSEFDLSIDL